MNILVVDVGTSSMRGILLTQDAEELAMYQKKYCVSYFPDGRAEQDPMDWENALYEILGGISGKAKENGWPIDAIALTAQRSSVLPVDREGNPLCNTIMWQDKRTNGICHRLEKQNKRIFQLAGSRVNPVFSACKMSWIRENLPELYQNTYKFMVVSDYLLFRLTGQMVTDHTYGSRSLLMNIHTRRWDDELLEVFQIDRRKLCDLIPPGCICGTLTKEAAELTGCPQGLPVITAGGDQQCGAVGQGVVKEGRISVTVGTGGYLIAASERVPLKLQQNVICNASSVAGKYILESSVLTCCSAFDWFCRNFYENESYEKINADIESSPVGAGGCLVLPYFQGRSTPDWNNEAKGFFGNITLSTKRRDMLRALLEGICYEIGNGIDVMKTYVPVWDIFINGGLTNSEPFNKIQANVYGQKVIRKGKSDATARGAMMVAAKELGLYTSVEEAFSAVNKNAEAAVYYPEQEQAVAYQRKKMEMNGLYRKIYAEDQKVI